VWMTSADFNGDGRADLVLVCRNSNNVAILLGNGDGTFVLAPGSPIAVGSSPVSAAVADFNGDGKVDLAIANDGDKTLTILLGNGDGSFYPTPESPLALAGGATVLAVGDFNGDGMLDLVVAAPFTDAYNISLLLGNGDGTFALSASSPVALPLSGRSPWGVAVADFNRDGRLDIAVASGVDDTVAVLLGNGDGTFSAVSGCCGTSEGLTSDFSAGLGDFNGNGKLDMALAIQNGEGGGPAYYVTLMVGNGDGTFAASNFSILGPAQPVALAVGDFDGNGELDIASADAGYAEVAILLQAPPPGNGPDFSLEAAGSTSISLQPGGTASFPLKVTSLNGFIGTVTFSCSGAPAKSTCSFVNYTNDLAAPDDFLFATEWGLFRLRVQTTAPTMTSGAAIGPQTPCVPELWIALLAFALIAAFVQGRRRSPRISPLAIASLATLLTYVIFWAACGGAPASPAPHPVGGTPPGTYTLTMTAASGGISHSTTVTLTVQ
jgi:hypothetical protein